MFEEQVLWYIIKRIFHQGISLLSRNLITKRARDESEGITFFGYTEPVQFLEEEFHRNKNIILLFLIFVVTFIKTFLTWSVAYKYIFLRRTTL